jgi:hypothetical protein
LLQVEDFDLQQRIDTPILTWNDLSTERMRILAKTIMIPIACFFTLVASISPFNLHTFSETITGHPIGEFWTIEEDSHSDHHDVADHRHSSDPQKSDPEHESSKILVFHSGSNSVSEQVLLFARTLWVSLDHLCAEQIECTSSVLPLRIDTGPPNSITLSILSRSCPETAPPSLV